MYRRRTKVDLASVEFRNSGHRHMINHYRSFLKKVDEDADRKKRLLSALCPVCYYNQSRIGGAACTRAQCAFCDAILNSGNTNIDVMCQRCAASYGLCKHCGADVDLKNRRKRVLPKPAEEAGDAY